MKIAVITYEVKGFFFGFEMSIMIGNYSNQGSFERQKQLFEFGAIY